MAVENNTKIISIKEIDAKYSILCFLIPSIILVIMGILSISSNILNILKTLNKINTEYVQIQ